ncbi:hypothetical protein CVT24_004668 [Panaeolus cyanescens]|uniref:Uncharacterized protein n=1 Tax=Panaeolus cyanescens TaxID=181874 RepID=A0A409X6L5_9AGAR|nr:hypothetical protein CVT24_004668 [Panaeolus cyanescens]
MTVHSSSPKTIKFSRQEDHDVLESLSGLSIKGFQDCTEANQMSTPSSTNASLPTPPAFKGSRVFLASPAHSFAGDELCPEQPAPISMPNALLLKDLDSFTDGTGHGSFNFPLGPCADDSNHNLPLFFHPDLSPVPAPLPLPVHHTFSSSTTTPTTESSSSSSPLALALDKLPHSQDDPTDAVLAWRANVISSPPPPPHITPKKRRRSLTQNSDFHERRTRTWSPTDDTALSICTDQVARQHQQWHPDAQPPD